MGDDNEIRQIVRKKSESFLDEARKTMAEAGKVYDLESEFRKTRKNRNLLVAGITVLTILVLAGAAVVATSIINKQTANTPVDVQAFEDLNLRDLLDTAKRDSAALQQAKVELSRIQAEEQAALDAIDKDAAAAAETIRARGYSKAEEKRRLGLAESQAASQRAAVRAKYASSLAAKQAEVKAVQARVDSYDQRMSDQAKKQQEVLDNQAKLNDLEKNKLVKTYEGKLADLKAQGIRQSEAAKRQKDSLAQSLTDRYNPTFDDQESLGLLGGFILQPDQAPMAWDEGLAKAGVMDKASYDAMNQSYRNSLLLASRLRAVPYINSVPPSLARLEYEARAQYSALNAALAKAAVAIKDRDAKIGDLNAKVAELSARVKAAEAALERYRWATASYVLENREGGYILDPRDSQDIALTMNPAVPVQSGSMAYVVRSGNVTVATLAFYTKDGQLKAKVVDLANGETLKAFDPIVVVTALPQASGPSH